jgi:hypothetical protein
MDYYFTYQQPDTLKAKSLLDMHLKTVEPAVLNVRRVIIPAEALKIDSTHKREIVIIPKPLTAAQLRYIQNKNEEKLLVDSSRYIKPRNEVNFNVLSTVVPKDIILPERQLNQVSYDWVTIILTISLFIFATVRIPYAKYIEHMFQSLINYPTATRMFRERNYSILHGAFRLDIYFYITLSLFIYQALKYFDTGLPIGNFSLYLFCVLAVIGYFSLKRMLYALIGAVNNGLTETNEYWFNLNNYNRALGLFLFPIVAIVAFSPYFNQLFFMILGLIITSVFFGMSLQRGVVILLKKQFSIFYLFLYLCTLEILPLLLIFKMVLA